MSSSWANLALVALLVLLNAAFAGSEMALVSLREGQLRQLERRTDRRAARVVRLARDPNRFLATIQIGITLAGFLASATAAVSLAQPLVPFLSALGTAAEGVAVGVITLLLTFVTLVFGELVPKRLAMQRALPWALAVAGPLDVLSRLSRPAVALLGHTVDAVVRLLGGRSDAGGQDISAEELGDLVTTNEALRAEQREIISGALELDKRTLRQVLVPRRKVFTLDAELTRAEALQALAGAGHSRAPVARGRRLDDVIGILHWTNALGDGDDPVASAVTPALFLPDSARVYDALNHFKTERQQMAVVVDEHGAVDGIVTLEDLLEEIVGEIYDENDKDLLAVERSEHGDLVLPGSFPLHDLPDVGIALSEDHPGGYTTVGGLVTDRLGRVPDRPGDVVDVDGWRVEVLAVDRRAVVRVRFSPSVVGVEGSAS